MTLASLKVSAQIEKGDVHIGVSGLPIVDLFNYYPDNKITGLGVMGQIGFFPHKNIFLGLNPYYAKVKNRYPESGSMSNENIKIYGINTSLSYYGAITSRFYLSAGVSFGIGVLDEKKYMDNWRFSRNATHPVFVVAPSLGVHYFITQKMAFNFNLPLINLKHISYTNKDNFRTLAPAIGLGFFF